MLIINIPSWNGMAQHSTIRFEKKGIVWVKIYSHCPVCVLSLECLWAVLFKDKRTGQSIKNPYVFLLANILPPPFLKLGKTYINLKPDCRTFFEARHEETIYRINYWNWHKGPTDFLITYSCCLLHTNVVFNTVSRKYRHQNIQLLQY